jgi:hypothetical protein
LHAGEVTIEGFTIINCTADTGGGIAAYDTNLAVVDCVLTSCRAEIGGAIWNLEGSLSLRGCEFSGNAASIAAGGVFSASNTEAEAVTVQHCVFVNNSTPLGIGGVGIGHFSCEVFNSRFTGNDAPSVAGGLGDACEISRIANCVFSHNTALLGSALSSGNLAASVVNCTFGHNTGIPLQSFTPMVLGNCIFWGNEPPTIDAPRATAAYCDVEGGFPGDANIDADPLFVQPGTGDLRLVEGSPCIDAGDGAALPPDALDLDGDGDLAEPLPLDLDGNPRIAGRAVDMGAYEGAFEEQKPASSETDIDQGEAAVLIPEGGSFDPVESSAVIVVNASGPDDATFTVTQYHSDLHPGAGGYAELSYILVTESTLETGELLATVFIPFDQGDLTWTGPLVLDTTAFDPATGHWRLAVERNWQDSPGHSGPVGDRIAVEGTGDDWGITGDVGDYGVFWNPAARRGFVWANLDYVAALGVGNPRCSGDCFPVAGDGAVEIRDLLALLGSWGARGAGGPADFAGDGLVDQVDLGLLIGGWGRCVEPASAPVPGSSPALAQARETPHAPRGGARSANLQGNGSVALPDLAALLAAWGPCSDCPADLDSDRVVGIRDLVALLGARSDGARP